jgi:hypothetical protein
MSQQCEKWKAELSEVLVDVEHIAKNRKVYWEIQEIVKLNEIVNKRNPIHDILASGYLLSGLMGLRRHIKIKKESVSFMRLLKEIRERPQEINTAYCRRLVDEDWRKDLLVASFEKYMAAGTDHIDPDIIEKDMNDLKNAFESSEAFADKKVAHLDKVPPSRIPNFKELEDSWDLFENLVQKYYSILTGVTLWGVAPVMQYDWKEALKVPWIKN